jgi:hypothetical protein
MTALKGKKPMKAPDSQPVKVSVKPCSWPKLEEE